MIKARYDYNEYTNETVIYITELVNNPAPMNVQKSLDGFKSDLNTYIKYFYLITGITLENGYEDIWAYFMHSDLHMQFTSKPMLIPLDILRNDLNMDKW